MLIRVINLHSIIRFMQKILIISVLIFFSTATFAQGDRSPVFFGIGGTYNFQTEGKAAEARVMLPLSNSFFFSPRISYFPSFNKINEYYAGADIDYFINLNSVLYPYLYAGVYYDNWINNNEFNSAKATRNNVNPEGGVGLAFDLGCINPYIEYRYDAKWKEGWLGAGLLIHFGSCFGSGRPSVNKCTHF